MDFLHPEALSILGQGGALVESGTQRVRFDPEWVETVVSTAPRSFPLHSRNPVNNLTIGANHITFATVASAPNASDADRGRRSGTFEDFCNFTRLGQLFNVIDIFGGYPVEPVDISPAVRHLDCLGAYVTMSDKPFHAYSLGRQRILDALEIVRIGRGVTTEQLRAEPSLYTVINTSSPLRLDGPDDRRAGGDGPHGSGGSCYSVHPLRGDGSGHHRRCPRPTERRGPGHHCPGPAGESGGAGDVRRFHLQRRHALGSAGLRDPRVHQGGIWPAASWLAGTGFPYRSSNACAANAVDAQAAYESEMSIWGAVMGHANLIMHAAGWMEGGLVASFEKFIIDVEICQMMSEFLQPLVVDESSLAFDAITEVGPGGHFFGAAHTLERYETAFYSPLISDWRNFENWQRAGAPTAADHANRFWKLALESYQQPAFDPALEEELTDFISRRKSEGGVAS